MFTSGHSELKLFPSRQERDHALKDLPKNQPEARLWLVVTVVACLASTLVEPWLAGRVTLPSWLRGGVIPLTIMILGSGVAWWRLRCGAPGYLRSRLIDCGVPVCLGCGYCLRGIASERCPECGVWLPRRVREIMACTASDTSAAASTS